MTILAAVLDNVNCDAYNNQLATTQQNADLAPVASFAPTTIDGVTVSYVAGVPWAGTSYNLLTCFNYTGTPADGLQPTVNVWGAGGSVNATGTNPFNDYCGDDSNLSGWWITAPLASYQVSMRIYDGGTAYSGPVVDSVMTQPNPTRHLECQILTTTGQTYSGDSASFTENDSTLPAVQCPPIAAGEIAAQETITEVGGGVSNTLQSESTTSSYQNWASEYPECANGSCALFLSKDGYNCFESGVYCDGWLTDPGRDSTYSCTYGTHAIALSECYIYGPTFDPANWSTGTAFGDPEDGTDVDAQTSPDDQDQLTENLMSRTNSAGYAALSAPDLGNTARTVAAACLALYLLDQCEGTAIWAPGNDVPEVASHDYDAIVTTGEPGVLTYMTRAAKIASGVSPKWYKSSAYAGGLCVGTTPTGQDCDEYPYFASLEGGPPSLTNPLGADLRYVNQGQNRSEGSKRYAFLAGICHLDTATGTDANFLVLPSPTAYPTGGFCKP